MANQADLPVRTMCRVLGVSASGFYAWQARAPSQRSIANAVMTERIRQIHQDSYESYGMPRVRAELIEQGVCISRQRVARLMRQAGIHGISKRRGITVTTRRDKRQTPACDLVNRRFHATGPNQLWGADMTHVRERWGMPTTTRWPRASLPAWKENSSSAAPSRARLRPAWQSSPGLKAGTTPGAATAAWATSHP